MALLRQARLPESLADFEADIAGPCPFHGPAWNDLLERFRQRPDFRRGHGFYHRQRFVLGCAALATLMGVCGYRAYELEKHQQRTHADSLPSWCRTRTFGPALAARRH